MKEGEDPHLYVATAGDVEKLQNADLVVYGGLHLEGKMTDIFSNLSNKYILNLIFFGIFYWSLYILI